MIALRVCSATTRLSNRQIRAATAVNTLQSFENTSVSPRISAPNPHLLRTFSTSNNAEKNVDDSILAKIMSPDNQAYFTIAGGTIGTLLFAKGMMSFTSFFTSLSPAVVAKYGFYLGFGTSTAMSGLAIFTADSLTIRANPVFKHCLAKVTGDTQAIDKLGDGIVPGNLRSYRLDSGKFEATSGTSLTWRNPRIQMIFDVRGQDPPFRTGVVTCEAVKVTGAFPPKLRTNILKIDYEDGNEGEGGDVEGDQTIWIKGDEEKYNRVSTRSGLSLRGLASAMHINKAAAGK